MNFNDYSAPDPNRRRRYSPAYTVRQCLLLATDEQAIKIGIQAQIARNTLCNVVAKLKERK